MDVEMILRKLRHEDAKDIVRGIAIVLVAAVCFVGLLANFYVG